MALMLKGQVRTAVRQAIDDPQSKRWSDANLDVLITMVQDTIVQAMLDSFEQWTFSIQTATTDVSNGTFCCLNPFGFNVYRFLRMSRTSDGVELLPKYPTDNVPSPWYYISGVRVYTSMLNTPVTVEMSYFPTRFIELANDATSLPAEYPEGHETALIYVAASWAMTKGDAESMAQISRIADMSVDAMLTHVARRYPIAANMRLQSVKNAIMRQPLVSPTSTVG